MFQFSNPKLGTDIRILFIDTLDFSHVHWFLKGQFGRRKENKHLARNTEKQQNSGSKIWLENLERTCLSKLISKSETRKTSPKIFLS